MRDSSSKNRSAARILSIAAAVLWCAAAAWIAPFDDLPVFDDWVYAWSAFELGAGRPLFIPEWSSVYPIFQVYAGASFVHWFGSGDAVLRLATLVFVALGHFCWASTLSRVGLSREQIVLAVVAAAFHPAYYLLTFTFMTDVWMVALWQIGIYATVRWSDSERFGWLLLATLSGLAAAYVRQTGAALLVGLFVITLRRRRGPIDSVLVRLSILAVLAGQVYFGNEVGEALPMTSRSADALEVLRVSPWVYVDGWAVIVGFLGLSAAPFALGLHQRELRRNFLWGLGAAALLGGVWFVGEAPMLRTGTFWGACELGGASSLLSGRPPECAWATGARAAALVASAFGWIAVGPALARGLAAVSRDYAGFAEALAATMITFAAGLTLLWLFADRYWVGPAVMLPALLMATGVIKTRVVPIAAGLAVYAAVAVAGTASVFDFYRNAEALRGIALEQGAEVQQVDAGYALNGRYRYLALDQAKTGSGRNKGMAWVSGLEASRWTVANRPEPGAAISTAAERGGLVLQRRDY